MTSGAQVRDLPLAIYDRNCTACPRLAQFLQEAGFHLAVHGLNFRRAMLASATP